MKPLSPRAKEVLAAYRRAEAPEPAVQARARAVMMQQLRTHVPAPSASPARLGRVSWLSRSARWLVTLPLLSLGIWAGTQFASPGASPRSSSRLAVVARSPSASVVTAVAGAEHARDVSPAAAVEMAPVLAAARPRAAVHAKTSARNAGSRTARSIAGRSPAPVEPPSAISGTSPDSVAAGVEPLAAAPRPDVPGAPARGAAGPRAGAHAEPAAAPSRAPDVRLEAPSAAPQGPSLDAEVLLLQRAHQQLASHQPLRALSALEEHGRRFPDGALSVMRAATRVLALCDLGRLSEARSAGERFLARHPASAYAARVRQSCVALAAQQD
ncbi:MAG TPA: hypothetical protein VFZ61_09430 [Polyangiales bacterium]